MMSKGHFIENREISIFLSSTFSDMDAERSALIKTFYTSKFEALKYNVTLSVLDLRWGVTDEESRSGKVLSVCLNEIEHSRPFFIGLLGSRYGYSPKISEIEKNPELEERYPWIREDIDNGKSITEIEMQYGVLRSHEDVDAIFYIKNTPDTLPDDDVRLTILKNKIKEQTRFPVFEYNSIEDLCSKVKEAIRILIIKYFPKEDTSRLGRERTAQKSYMNSRHGYYIKNEENFRRLDHFFSSGEKHLVVTGASGMGKSSLIANWLKENEQQKDIHHYNIVYHFVGNSLGDNSYEDILQHIYDEVCDLYRLEENRNSTEAIETRLLQLLAEAVNEDKPLLIVIDGINQITSSDNTKQLRWLPQTPHVKYLFSTVDDDETMQTFKRLEYPIYRIHPLRNDQRRDFIVNYLAAVGKKLNEDQLSRILYDHGKRNMLVLKSFLDELICFGSYEKLDSRIDYYLSAKSVTDFFKKLLQRIHTDYEKASSALSIITYSEHGLTEEEIIEITGLRKIDWHLLYCAIYNHLVVRNGYISFAHQRLTDAARECYDSYATRLIIVNYFASKEMANNSRRISELAYQYYHLNDNDNLYKIILSFDAINFYNSTERGRTTLAHYWIKLVDTEAEERYLDNCLERARWDIPDEMVFYKTFFDNYLNNNTAYGFKYNLMNYLSLPVQGVGLDDMPYERIGRFLDKYLNAHNTAIMYYMKQLERIKSAFGDSFDENQITNIYSKAKKPSFITKLSMKLLGPWGFYNPEASKYYGSLYEAIGFSYYCSAKFRKASMYTSWALKIKTEQFGKKHLSTTDAYENMGLIYNKLGDYEKARLCFNAVLKIRAKELGNGHPQLIASYIHLGDTYENEDDFYNAVEYYNKATALSEKTYGEKHAETAKCYTKLCNTWNRIGLKGSQKRNKKMCLTGYDSAMLYGKKAVAILEKEYGYFNIYTASAYHHYALVLYNVGINNELEYLSKALDIRKKLLGNYHPDTANTYYYIGLIYEQDGKYSDSLKYYNEAIHGMQKLSDGVNTVTDNSASRHNGFHVNYWAVKECIKRVEKMM